MTTSSGLYDTDENRYRLAYALFKYSNEVELVEKDNRNDQQNDRSSKDFSCRRDHFWTFAEFFNAFLVRLALRTGFSLLVGSLITDIAPAREKALHYDCAITEVTWYLQSAVNL